jgi:hypothetical protein
MKKSLVGPYRQKKSPPKFWPRQKMTKIDFFFKMTRTLRKRNVNLSNFEHDIIKVL